MNSSFGGPPAAFTFIPFIFTAVFVIILGIYVFKAAKGIFNWTANNAAEAKSARCNIVAKRMQVFGGAGNSSSRTAYYVTFEFENCERAEFKVPGSEYGLLAEGDLGVLAYQGSRFNGFERD